MSTAQATAQGTLAVGINEDYEKTVKLEVEEEKKANPKKKAKSKKKTSPKKKATAAKKKADEIDEEAEDEALMAELMGASEDEQETEIKKAKPKKKTKKIKKQAAAKKEKKEPTLKAEIETTEAVELDEPVEEKKPKRERRTKERRTKQRRTAEAEVIELDSKDDPTDTLHNVSIASAAMQKSMESMVKQWGSVKDISGSLTNNLEKITKLVNEIPDTYGKSMDEMVKRQPPKQSSAHKMAVGASAIAIIFSFISLVFSQTARQTVMHEDKVALKPPALSHDVAKALPMFPTKNETQTTAPNKPITKKAIAKQSRKKKIRRATKKKKRRSKRRSR